MNLPSTKGKNSPFLMRLKRAVIVLLYRVLPVAVLLTLTDTAHYPSSITCLLVFSLWSSLEAWIEDPTSNKTAVQSTQDKWSRPAILWTHLFAWFAPFLEFVFLGLKENHTFLFLGCAAFIIGGLLRLISVHTLGEYFTAHVMTHKNQKVCRVGPYAYVRHPSYVGLFLINVSLPIMLNAPFSLWIVLVSSLIGISFRVRIEEGILSRSLGSDYDSYCDETPRWLPFFRKPSSK